MKTELITAVLISLASVLPSATAGEFEVKRDDNSISIYLNGSKTLTYVYGRNLIKPYVKELFTPGGINVLWDSPPDHKHHHGLMYAVKIDGINFWEESEKSGFQVSEMEAVHNSNDGSGFSSTVRWLDPEKKEMLLREKRSVSIYFDAEMKASILSWQSELSTPPGKNSVSLTGSHYHGLGMRFPEWMNKTGEFLTAGNRQGKIFRGQERLIDDRWCAYRVKLADKKVTVAMFASPDNPGGETTWFTMKEPFAYLSATMKLHETTFRLTSEKQLKLKYAVALWDGKISSETFEKAFKKWLDKIKSGD